MIAKVVVAKRLTADKNFFDYQVPLGSNIHKGAVVFVPWRNQQIWGVVFDLVSTSSFNKHLKEITEVLPFTPLTVTDLQAITLLAQYYKVSPSLILKSFFPDPPRRLKNINKAGATQIKLGLKNKKLPSIYWLKNQETWTQFAKKLIKQLNRPVAFFFPLIRELEDTATLFPQKDASFWQLREDLLANKITQPLLLTRKSAFLLPPYSEAVLVHAERREFVQFDMNPRYDLEHVLKVRGLSPTLLVEAPRFIDWHLAENKKVTLYKTPQKVALSIVALPPDDFILISPELTEDIRAVLNKNQEVYIFHWQKEDAQVIYCADCDFKLGKNQIPVANTCPACHGHNINIKFRGPTTWLKRATKILPELNNPHVHLKTVAELPDFTLPSSQIGLIVVLWADLYWQYPRFDANWQAWQKLTTIQHLAVLVNSPLIIQTRDINHPVIQALQADQPKDLYTQEKNEWQKNCLPPLGTYIRFLPKKSKITKLPNELIVAIKNLAGRSYLEEKKTYLIYLPIIQEEKIQTVLQQLPNDWLIDRYPFI